MFIIEYAEGVADDLSDFKAFDRSRILDAIEEQLIHQPTTVTRNKKILMGLVPPWDHDPPVWELRIGEIRVFYDVDAKLHRVVVRAIRHKPPHRETRDIL